MQVLEQIDPEAYTQLLSLINSSNIASSPQLGSPGKELQLRSALHIMCPAVTANALCRVICYAVLTSGPEMPFSALNFDDAETPCFQKLYCIRIGIKSQKQQITPSHST